MFSGIGKRVFSVLLLIIIISACISAWAETDFSWLDELSINQLKELDEEIHKRIPNEDGADSKTERQLKEQLLGVRWVTKPYDMGASIICIRSLEFFLPAECVSTQFDADDNSEIYFKTSLSWEIIENKYIKLNDSYYYIIQMDENNIISGFISNDGSEEFTREAPEAASKEPLVETYVKIKGKDKKEQILNFGELRKMATDNKVAFEQNYPAKGRFDGATVEVVGQISEINGATNLNGHSMSSYIVLGKRNTECWVIETSGYEDIVAKLSVGDYIKATGNLWYFFGDSFYVYKVNDNVVKLEMIK